MNNSTLSVFNECIDLLHKVQEDLILIENISKGIELMSDSIKSGHKILTAGNGGSICDAIHFAEELTGRFCKDRPSLPAIAITDPGHITCTANDYGYDSIFSRYLEGVGQKGDVFLAISTSGNSPNLIKATNVAKTKGISTIGFLGKDGGQLKNLVDIALIVPHLKTERIQEIHTKFVHLFISGIEKKIFGDL